MNVYVVNFLDTTLDLICDIDKPYCTRIDYLKFINKISKHPSPAAPNKVNWQVDAQNNIQ